MRHPSSWWRTTAALRCVQRRGRRNKTHPDNHARSLAIIIIIIIIIYRDRSSRSPHFSAALFLDPPISFIASLKGLQVADIGWTDSGTCAYFSFSRRITNGDHPRQSTDETGTNGRDLYQARPLAAFYFLFAILKL